MTLCMKHERIPTRNRSHIPTPRATPTSRIHHPPELSRDTRPKINSPRRRRRNPRSHRQSKKPKFIPGIITTSRVCGAPLARNWVLAHRRELARKRDSIFFISFIIAISCIANARDELYRAVVIYVSRESYVVRVCLTVWFQKAC